MKPIIIIDGSIFFFTIYLRSVSDYLFANGNESINLRETMSQIKSRFQSATSFADFRRSSRSFLKDQAIPIDFETLHQSIPFKQLFEKNVYKAIEKILRREMRRWNENSYAKVYILKDTPITNNWRRKRYPFYKAQRKPMDKYDPKVAQYFWNHTVPSMAVKYGIHSIEMEELEADDLAYLLKNALTLKEITPISIITNDKDYLQLADSTTLIIKMNGEQMDTYEDDKAIKILTGDTSDNIPPIFKGCGPKTAEKIIAAFKGPDAFLKSLKNSDFLFKNVATFIYNKIKTKGFARMSRDSASVTLENLAENIKRNAELIDMTMIPQKYVEEFNRKVFRERRSV
jgi:5'-3' exonuclease